VLDELRRPDGVSPDSRRRLAAKAFQHCAVYDTHVALYLRPHDEIFPDEYTVALRKVADMRSGENPHQLAAFYAESSPRPRLPGLATASQLHGKRPPSTTPTTPMLPGRPCSTSRPRPWPSSSTAIRVG
jgi:phosphoribosylaminoimidazolecarboxamide formyltransferase/IMP cyclohydrolase